jgi:peptide/nickel transport system substrate-binding protein
MLNTLKRFIFVTKRGGSAANTSAGGFGPGPYHLRANNKRATLTLSLDKPWRNLMGLFSGLPMVCPAGLKALESDPRALENAVYGSGPYTLVSAQHNNQISYKLRTAWKWGPAGTSTKNMARNLNFKVVADPTTAANLLITGGLDIATITGPDVKRLLSTSSLGYSKAHNWVVTGAAFNMRAGRLFQLGSGDVLREAVFTAIDPKAFNTTVYEGRGTVPPSIFNPQMECYDKTTAKLRPTPSIAKAKQILAAGGYTVVNGRLSKGGQPVPKIVITSSTAFFPSGGAYVLSVVEALGFDAELNDLGANYGPVTIGGNFDIDILFANRPSLEPGSHMNSIQGLTATPSGTNVPGTGIGDPLWTKYYNAALQNVGVGSCRYFALVQKSVIQNHYYVPLVSPSYDVFYRKSLIKSKFPTWPPDAFGFPWFKVTG